MVSESDPAPAVADVREEDDDDLALVPVVRDVALTSCHSSTVAITTRMTTKATGTNTCAAEPLASCSELPPPVVDDE